MNEEQKIRFNEANKVVHPVQGEWHFPILTAAGFKPVTLEGVGFVRSYKYIHEDGRSIVCTTGVNSDRWEDQKTMNEFGRPKWGYWTDLESYICKETA